MLVGSGSRRRRWPPGSGVLCGTRKLVRCCWVRARSEGALGFGAGLEMGLKCRGNSWGLC